MVHVVMLIHTEAGAYGASFPDFPGATTVAGDLDTLYRKAADMLAFHVDGLIADGDPVPVPRPLDALKADPDFRADSAGAMVGLVQVELPGRVVRVTISMEEGLLRQVDRAAEAAGESRSGFLARAAKARMKARLRVRLPADA
ncbi:type II toxin-antitoxin system HicB family antitoxin [Methylobacterium sp. NEAU 140]|uniref:type II toxin-antitoxin system HicB family antitoxin n=1 Tax=Methylobacterium sp. NEAU 140 TaxID=3064945 RepID=UPI00273722B3|nr:type II toxin-antitoxin system HicB family antitoxin [Methylobacterium sp. NEAU 140]MDP4024079.1 type II toxin-antitoxin system HicB family antitoxin [Methylobacterium sp. NEAU 140]